MNLSVKSRPIDSKGLDNIHIDGSESTVSDGAADSTGEGETSVQGNALGLLLGDGLSQSSGSRGHCDGDECARRRRAGGRGESRG